MLTGMFTMYCSRQLACSPCTATINTLKFWIWWKEANELDETWCAITLLPYLDRKCMRIAIGRCTRALETKNCYRGVSEARPLPNYALETMQRSCCGLEECSNHDSTMLSILDNKTVSRASNVTRI